MPSQIPHFVRPLNRRDFLSRAGAGFGAVALNFMLGQENANASPSAGNALGKPHHPPKAKSVIWLFMEGGPSHLDLFDPKPALKTLAGKPMPDSYGRPITAMGTPD